jgi:1,4-dihydroxy-2-naphthoate octaprenyltransferase
MRILSHFLLFVETELSSLLGRELVSHLIVIFFSLFFLAFFLISQIRKLVIRLGVFDTPDDRSSHTYIVPYLGGFSHAKATFLIGLTNLVVASIMFVVIREFNTTQSMFILISIFSISCLLLFILNKSNIALRLKLKINAKYMIFLKLYVSMFSPLFYCNLNPYYGRGYF